MRRRDVQTPLHPSLVRPVLVGGAERELVLVNMLAIAVLLLGVGPHPMTLGLALVLATLGHSALVFAARFDPQLWRVYQRHLRYQPFYPARATWNAPFPTTHPFDLHLR